MMRIGLRRQSSSSQSVTMTKIVPAAVVPFFLLLLVVAVLVDARDCAKSWRRDWRDLDCDQQNKFLQTIVDMKREGYYDEFVVLHETVADVTHGTPLFLPWHRWFIYQFEKALQDQAGECIYLPYWSSERDDSQEDAAVFHPETFGTYRGTYGDSCVSDGIADTDSGPFRRSIGIRDDPVGCLTRDFGFPSFSFATEGEILALLTNYDRFENTANFGGSNGFASDLENGGAHQLVHGIIGGHMQTNWSPADPLFWLLHTNVDRIWAMWQDYWDHDWLDYWDFESPWHFDGGGLDNPMPFTHPDNWWDFRMVDSSTGERWYPSPRDVLSYESEYMQVQYQNDFLSTLIPDYEPNPNLFQQASSRVRTRCRDRGWNEWWRRDRSRQRERRLTTDTAENINEEESPESTASSSKQQTTSTLVANDLSVSFEQQWNGKYQEQQQQEDHIHLAVPQSCRLKNNFTKQFDQEKWDRLCRDLPPSTTVAERFALMAEEDCAEKGNPLSVTAEKFKYMTTVMNMSPHVFECFHRPDPSV
mmetsp:Transcript_10651/g.25408  ORF Transcript_10651/g.25408 Transcript_10651/m.25408 type:complete len:531 (+) Transcript_10651:501-2093(+)